MKEREGPAFRQSVGLANLDRFPQRGGARFEMLGGVRRVLLGQPPPYNTHIVSRDAPRDGALLVAPGQRRLEERHGFLQLRPGLTEVGESRREVVKRAGAPAAFVVDTEVFERGLELRSGPGEIGRRTLGPEEDAEVVMKARPLDLGRKRQLRQLLPEIVGQCARRGRVLGVGQLLLKAEPLPVRRFGVGAKRLPESDKQILDVLADGQCLRFGVGVQVTAG